MQEQKKTKTNSGSIFSTGVEQRTGLINPVPRGPQSSRVSVLPSFLSVWVETTALKEGNPPLENLRADFS